MAKYSLPIQIITYVDIEADNLADAVNNISTAEIGTITPEKISEWDISDYHCMFKNDEAIEVKKDEDLLIADVYNTDELKDY